MNWMGWPARFSRYCLLCSVRVFSEDTEACHRETLSLRVWSPIENPVAAKLWIWAAVMQVCGPYIPPINAVQGKKTAVKPYRLSTGAAVVHCDVRPSSKVMTKEWGGSGRP